LLPSSHCLSSFSSPRLCCCCAGDLRRLLVLALSCEVMLLATCLDLFLLLFSFFLSIPVWASTRGPVMETTSASLHRSNLLVLHQRRISWLLGLFSFVFLLLCRLGMNPNPSTPVFFHRACAGGRAGPRPSSSLSSPLFRTRSTIWPDLHQIRIPTTAAALAASLSGPTSSPPSPLPYHMIPIGGIRLVAPSSMKDAHR
jgi:hypothetical protein